MEPAFTYEAAASGEGDKPPRPPPAAPVPADASAAASAASAAATSAAPPIDTGAAGAAPPAPPLPRPSRSRTFLDDVLPDTDCEFCLDTRAKLAGALAAVGRAAEGSTGAAADGVASGVAALRKSAAAAKHRVEEIVETGTAHAAATEEAAFGRLKAGITYAADRPNATAAIGAATLLLAFPTTRRALWRATLGRLQSEEGRVRRAVDRAAAAGEVVASLRSSAAGASSRADAALTEYERARAGMVNVAASLRALERQAAAAEREAAAALEGLRGVPVPPSALEGGAGAGHAGPGGKLLPPPPALVARGEAANAAAEARAARRAIADKLWGVARFGY